MRPPPLFVWFLVVWLVWLSNTAQRPSLRETCKTIGPRALANQHPRRGGIGQVPAQPLAAWYLFLVPFFRQRHLIHDPQVSNEESASGRENSRPQPVTRFVRSFRFPVMRRTPREKLCARSWNVQTLLRPRGSNVPQRPHTSRGQEYGTYVREWLGQGRVKKRKKGRKRYRPKQEARACAKLVHKEGEIIRGE